MRRWVNIPTVPVGRATKTSPVSRRLAVALIVVCGSVAAYSQGRAQTPGTAYIWHRIVRGGADLLTPEPFDAMPPEKDEAQSLLTPWVAALQQAFGQRALAYQWYALTIAEFRALYAAAPANGVHPAIPLIGQGIGEFQRGSFERARIYMTEAITEAESRSRTQAEWIQGEALYWISASHLADRSQPAARIARLLHDLIREYPNHPRQADALYLLGLIDEEEKNPSSALEHFLEILRIAPNYWDEFSIRLRAVQCAIASNDSAAAARQLEALKAEAGGGQEVRPDSTYYAYQLLRGEFELNRSRYIDAEDAFIALASTDIAPFRRRGMLGLADTYAAAGQHDSAFAINSRLVEADATDQTGQQAAYNVAIALAASGHEADAEDRLRRIADTPGHLRRDEARFDLALIRFRRGDNDTARVRLQESLSESPSPFLARRTHILLGTILLADGHYDEAAGHLRLAAPPAHTPDLSGIDDRVRRYLLAIALVRSGRASDAVPILLNIEGDPRETDGDALLYWLGEAYYGSGLYPAAVEALERLIRASPSSRFAEPALYTIGWSNLRLKRYDSAEFAYARMVKAYPHSDRTIEATLRRADCLYALGRYAESADVYVSAVMNGATGDHRLYADYQRIVALRRAGARFDSFLAATRFQACHAKSPLTADAAYLEGLAAEEAGDAPTAIAGFLKAASKNERPEVRIQALAHLTRLYASERDLPRACAAAVFLADSAPTPGGRQTGADLLSDLQRLWSEADGERIDPRDPAALAEFYLDLNMPAAAEGCYRQVAEQTGIEGYELAADLAAVRSLLRSDRNRAAEEVASLIDRRNTGGLPAPAFITTGRLLLDLGDSSRARQLMDSLSRHELPADRRGAAASLARDAGLPEAGLRILEPRTDDTVTALAPLPLEGKILRVDLLLDLQQPVQAREALLKIDAEGSPFSDQKSLLDARYHLVTGDQAGARRLLEELMSHPVWSSTTRHRAMAMLAEIYRASGESVRADNLRTALSRERCEPEAQTPSADHDGTDETVSQDPH